MRYASVCSGIEAATVAWAPLGWECAFVSEIAPFPCAVLAHHYPDVANLGDMTKITEADLGAHGAIDLLVGGTPCQSFSVAGLRKGMADPRGNLALEFLRLLDRVRARWVVWENVPGVLSSHGGRDFGSFLGALAELGYGWAYRVLDAQFFGLAQRRKRVFVVGHLGDWRRAAAVLLERASLRGDPPPSREAGAHVARCVAAGAGGSKFGSGRDGQDDFVVGGARCTCQEAFTVSAAGSTEKASHTRSAEVARALDSNGGLAAGQGGTVILDGAAQGADRIPSCGSDAVPRDEAGARGLPPTERGRCAVHFVVNALDCRKGGADDNEAQAGHLVAVLAFDPVQVTSDKNYSNPKPGDPCHPLAKGSASGATIAFHVTQDPISGPISPAISAGNKQGCGTIGVAYQCHGTNVGPMGTLRKGNGDVQSGVPFMPAAMGVRRLTPTECERLMGMPDGYTDIPYRGKRAADGPRYQSLGNSMAVPVVRWIGERIAAVDAIGGAK